MWKVLARVTESDPILAAPHSFSAHRFGSKASNNFIVLIAFHSAKKKVIINSQYSTSSVNKACPNIIKPFDDCQSVVVSTVKNNNNMLTSKNQNYLWLATKCGRDYDMD